MRTRRGGHGSLARLIGRTSTGGDGWSASGGRCLLISIATFMLLLDITIVNVALPDIQRDLNASLSSLQWVVDAYSLMLAALLLTAGSLGDRVGRRRVFSFGLGVFTVASFLCGIAGDPTLLNLARGLQGVGGAAMFATSLALIAQEFQGRDRATAIGVWGATIGGAVAIGPLVGGLITEHLGWEWIFFVNVPIGIAAIVLTETRLANVARPGRGARSTVPGLITFCSALFLLIFGLIRGNPDGWGSAADPRLADRRPRCCSSPSSRSSRAATHPMLDLTLFRKPAFNGVSVGRLLPLGGDVRDVPLPDPLHPGRAGLLAVAGRPALPAAQRRLLRCRPDRGAGSRAGAAAGADGPRVDHGRGRPPADPRRLPRLVLDDPACRASSSPGSASGSPTRALARARSPWCRRRWPEWERASTTPFARSGSPPASPGWAPCSSRGSTPSSRSCLPGGKAGHLGELVSSGGTQAVAAAVPPGERPRVVEASGLAFTTAFNEIALIAALVTFAGAVLGFALTRSDELFVPGAPPEEPEEEAVVSPFPPSKGLCPETGWSGGEAAAMTAPQTLGRIRRPPLLDRERAARAADREPAADRAGRAAARRGAQRDHRRDRGRQDRAGALARPADGRQGAAADRPPRRRRRPGSRASSTCRRGCSRTPSWPRSPSGCPRARRRSCSAGGSPPTGAPAPSSPRRSAAAGDLRAARQPPARLLRPARAPPAHPRLGPARGPRRLRRRRPPGGARALPRAAPRVPADRDASSPSCGSGSARGSVTWTSSASSSRRSRRPRRTRARRRSSRPSASVCATPSACGWPPRAPTRRSPAATRRRAGGTAAIAAAEASLRDAAGVDAALDAHAERLGRSGGRADRPRRRAARLRRAARGGPGAPRGARGAPRGCSTG